MTKAKPSTVHILLSLLQTDAIVMWRQRKSVAMSILLPLIFLISWRGIVEQGGSGFVLAVCITEGSIGIGVLSYTALIARDRERGVFQRLRAAPIPSWTIMVSRILLQLLVTWIMACLVLVCAYLLDHIVVDAESIILTLILSVVSGTIFLALGQAVVGLISAVDSVNGTARLLSLPLIFVGGLGVMGFFGDAVKTIVIWSPFGVAQSLLQFALSPMTWTGQLGLVLVLAIVYTSLFAGIGIRYFKWSVV